MTKAITITATEEIRESLETQWLEFGENGEFGPPEPPMRIFYAPQSQYDMMVDDLSGNISLIRRF